MVLVPTDRTDYAAFLTGLPDICAENARFFQRGRLYPGVLRPQRPSSRIKTKKPHILKEKDRRCSMKNATEKDRPDLVPEIFAQQPALPTRKAAGPVFR